MTHILKKRITLYLLFSFAITWAAWLGCFFLRASVLVIQIVNMAVMWVPAASVWITWLITKRSQIQYYSLKPKLKGNIRYYLYAWWLPIIMVMAGGALFFIVFPAEFDSSLSYIRQLVLQTGGEVEDIPLSLSLLAATQIAAQLITAPFINMLFALGEEIGWRGFLFPALSRRFSSLKAHLLSGLIWGIWHTPINMMGHNYGVSYFGYPWLGVIAMCIFTFSMGVFLSWLSAKSRSVWPAALAHGALNAAGGVPMLFFAADSSRQILGPGISGLVAGIPTLILAVMILSLSAKKQKLTVDPQSNLN